MAGGDPLGLSKRRQIVAATLSSSVIINLHGLATSFYYVQDASPYVPFSAETEDPTELAIWQAHILIPNSNFRSLLGEGSWNQNKHWLTVLSLSRVTSVRRFNDFLRACAWYEFPILYVLEPSPD